jgi:hypothetical protein
MQHIKKKKAPSGRAKSTVKASGIPERLSNINVYLNKLRGGGLIRQGLASNQSRVSERRI